MKLILNYPNKTRIINQNQISCLDFENERVEFKINNETIFFRFNQDVYFRIFKENIFENEKIELKIVDNTCYEVSTKSNHRF